MTGFYHSSLKIYHYFLTLKVMSKIVSKNNKRYVTLNEAKGLGWVDLMAEILRSFYSPRMTN